MGRNTLYSEKEADAAVASVIEQGATMAQIAAALGVSQATVYQWQRRYPEFAESVNAARAKADSRIECKLYEAACAGDLAATRVWFANRSPAVKPASSHELFLEEVLG